jgi:hypothetical protein
MKKKLSGNDTVYERPSYYTINASRGFSETLYLGLGSGSSVTVKRRRTNSSMNEQFKARSKYPFICNSFICRD